MEKLASRERILRTVAGQPVDRVPIFAPVPWHPLAPEPDPKNWKARPNYQRLLPLVAEHCDFFVHLDVAERVPIGNPGGGQVRGHPSGSIFDRRFFLAHPENVHVIEDRLELDTMLQIIQERLSERLHWALEHGVGPFLRFGGSEQATPPMMSKRLFEEFIIGYEAPLWKMVREAGGIVWVHCHGKVATVLNRFVENGVQMLDPVEPPPQGDITIKEAKARAAAGPLTLIGNVEMSDLQNGTPELIERLVREAICEGGRKHFIMGTSEVTVSAVDDQLRENIIAYLETAARYAPFERDRNGG